MSRSLEESAALLLQVDEHLSQPRRKLSFEPALEAVFQSERNALRNRQAYFAVAIALTAFNVLLLGMYFDGQIVPEKQTSVFMLAQMIVSLPSCLFLLAARRGMRPATREVAMVVAYFLVTLGSVIINRGITASSATYDAFTSILIIITCNIALPISFRAALAGSALSVGLLSVAALVQPAFPTHALTNLILLYLAGAAVTLAANHRYETLERLNFLNYQREILRNIFARHTNMKLSLASRTDPLTGIANRRAFDDKIGELRADAIQKGSALSLLMIDIDHFKAYNDIYGHPAGDKCLVDVAQAVERASGGQFTARLGGEEFAVLLVGATASEAEKTAWAIHDAVHALAVPHIGLGASGIVTVSIGAATMAPGAPESATSLAERADRALYSSKRAGRDRVVVGMPDVA